MDRWNQRSPAMAAGGFRAGGVLYDGDRRWRWRDRWSGRVGDFDPRGLAPFSQFSGQHRWEQRFHGYAAGWFGDDKLDGAGRIGVGMAVSGLGAVNLVPVQINSNAISPNPIIDVGFSRQRRGDVCYNSSYCPLVLADAVDFLAE